MMKKLLIMMIATVLAVSLTACGNKDNAMKNQPGSSESSESSTSEAKDNEMKNQQESLEPEMKVIDFENTVLADNDVVTVELVQFYEEEVNWNGPETPVFEKNITLQVKNKSDYEIIFNYSDAYIGDEAVRVSMYDGNEGPAPGKSKKYRYCIEQDTAPDHTPLESIEDLYDLDGNFEISIVKEGVITDTYDLDFSIPKAISGEKPEENTVDEIEAALQGTWSLPDGSGSFTFNAGTLAISSQGKILNGTYEIQTSDKEINGEFSTTDDQSVTIQIPYTFEDGTLHVYNNHNVEMEKE